VIALTMGVFMTLFSNGGFSEFSNEQVRYFLFLVLSTVLIAAAGNIINDYFDLKADRINKPEKLIIDTHIKRRWAILLNWSFNGIGLSIAICLSYVLSNWYLAILSFISINLLFFYSLYFKRKFLVGNLIVAFLTALVPLQIVIFSYSFNYGHCAGVWTPFQYLTNYRFEIFFYCGFAFMLNFIREIIKDIADVKGDLLLFSSSIPIKLGFRNTKIILIFLFTFTIFGLVYAIYSLLYQNRPQYNISDPFDTVITLLALCILSMMISLFFLLKFNQRKYYIISSNFLKLAMLFGLLTPLFL